MKQSWLKFFTRKIDMRDMLNAGSILMMILMVIIFFAGCETRKKDHADANSPLREPDTGHEIHGEVGVMYGQGMSRR